LEACSGELRLSEKTIRAYAYDLGQFGDFLENKGLEELDIPDVNRYLDYLDREQRLKGSTIRRKVMTLKAFFRYFVEKGRLSEAPLGQVEQRYKQTKSVPKILNAQDMIRLLDFLVDDVKHIENQLRPGCGRKVKLHYENAVRDRAIIELLFATAMRIGELSDLDVADLDLDNRTIHIRGKGRRDRTLVLGSTSAVESLRDFLRMRRHAQGDARALFLNRFGGRLSIFAVENVFERVRRAAGVRRRITPHVLRHTMATMLLNNGKDIRQVQNILGHSSAVTTQIYEEIAPRRHRRVLDDLNQNDRLAVHTIQEAPLHRPRTIRRRKGEKGIPAPAFRL
jgi:integrase/recombinase XerC/integrase/recombinase XerD